MNSELVPIQFMKAPQIGSQSFLEALEERLKYDEYVKEAAARRAYFIGCGLEVHIYEDHTEFYLDLRGAKLQVTTVNFTHVEDERDREFKLW